MILTYKGSEIQQREEDSYVNATQMCVGNGKKVNDWLRLEQTNAYIQGISTITGIPAIELVITKQGSPTLGGGTWIHPKLAIELGRWISVDFAIWCDMHIKTLLETGKTEIEPIKPKTALELAKEQVKLLEQLEIQQSIIEEQEKDLLRQSEVIDELFDYSSILRIAIYNNVSEKNFSYHRLKAVSKMLKLKIKSAPCPRFGKKNLYSHDVWRYAYPLYKLPETTTLVIQNL
jgi:hypothetical protein